MKKIAILKGSKTVTVETVSTIKAVNRIVERFKKNGFTVRVFSV